VGIGAEGLAFDPPVHPFQAVNATPINPQILGHRLGRHSCRLAVFFSPWSLQIGINEQIFGGKEQIT
jgi:hypothetical protein